MFPFTKRQSITKAFATQKSTQTLSHLGDMTIGADVRGWTPEATLGEGESHLVKANAVDPKHWKVRPLEPETSGGDKDAIHREPICGG